MSPNAYNHEFNFGTLVAVVAIVILLRLIRWARLNIPADTTPQQAAPRRPLWGPVRRLERLQQDTAIVRTETELLTSTGENLQARHHLKRLKDELEPAARTRHRLARPGDPSLTIPEMRAVLATIDMPRELRAMILELLEATANEKVRQ